MWVAEVVERGGGGGGAMQDVHSTVSGSRGSLKVGTKGGDAAT